MIDPTEVANALKNLAPDTEAMAKATPKEYLSKAEPVVKRRQDETGGVTTYNKLSAEDYQYLNYLAALSDEERHARLAEMRQRYSDDKTALGQIDAFDWESPFGKRMKEIVAVANARDFEKAKELRVQLKRDFPDHPNT